MCLRHAEKFQECSKTGGVGLATTAETLGVDWRTRTKQLGAKEKNRVFQQNFLRIGVRKLLRMGWVLARVWGGQAVGISPTEKKLKLRRQVAVAAGKKESVSLSLFLEVNNLEVEEELSTMTTLFWAEGVWIGRRRREQQKAWRKQIFEVQTWRQVGGLAGAVMCQTRDLGIKWPQRHTLLFEGQVAVDMRLVCPQNVKKMLLKQNTMVCWKK